VAAADHTIKQNSQLPSIRARLRGPNVHLASSVDFRMKQVVSSGTPLTKGGAGFIEDAGTPNVLVVRYDWALADTDTIAFFDGEWWVTIAGKVMKLPAEYSLRVEVKDDAA
jgi:hypothetical protein